MPPRFDPVEAWERRPGAATAPLGTGTGGFVEFVDAFSSGAETGSIDKQAHSLLTDVTLRWYRAEHVELSSALAAGAGRWSRAGTGMEGLVVAGATLRF
jgi:hypothetical protein